MRLISLALATGCGVGYIPFAPGTFGSLVGLLLWAAVGQLALPQVLTIGVVFAIGVWSGSAAERHFRATDPGPVVIDEVLGMLITLFMNPVGWGGALGGFFLFRLFDVVKPYPANHFERLPGGLGIMSDDAIAAVYANIVLRVALALGRVIT